MEAAVNFNSADLVENILRDELAGGNAVIGTVVPILRHLLDNGDNSLFADDIVASVRGMASDISHQLLDEIARVSGEAEKKEHGAGDIQTLTAAFLDCPALLGHIHALALEWHLTQRLQTRLAIDPVLPPLLQSLMASADPATSGLAMNLLAAQARFCQAQRRMKLPLLELPGDLLHGVLLAMRTLAGTNGKDSAATAETSIRSRYDESRTRLGIISRLITGMGGSAVEALSVSHSGAAMFLSALALASEQDRDLAALSTNESQVARLALSLRATGMKPQLVEMQFLSLHPDISLPDGFDQLGPDRAAAILAAAAHLPGG